jgi:hypothetical protein
LGHAVVGNQVEPTGKEHAAQRTVAVGCKTGGKNKRMKTRCGVQCSEHQYISDLAPCVVPFMPAPTKNVLCHTQCRLTCRRDKTIPTSRSCRMARCRANPWQAPGRSGVKGKKGVHRGGKEGHKQAAWRMRGRKRGKYHKNAKVVSRKPPPPTQPLLKLQEDDWRHQIHSTPVCTLMHTHVLSTRVRWHSGRGDTCIMVMRRKRGRAMTTRNGMCCPAVAPVEEVRK